jgi:hypothetical protein
VRSARGGEVGLDCATVAEVVAAALREVLGADGLDVIPDETEAIVDIAADEWTLQIEGSPVTRAWLSIEDEPEHEAQLAAARRKVMSIAVDSAFAEADRQLGGALIAALRASDDPLTLDLASAMERDS